MSSIKDPADGVWSTGRTQNLCDNLVEEHSVLTGEDHSVDLDRYFRQLAGPLDAIRRLHGLDSETAKDIQQEVAVRFLRCEPRIASPEGWILVVFRNECLRLREKRQASGERKLTFVQLGEASRPEARPLDRVLLDEVLAALSRLKARDQNLLRGRYFEGLSLTVLAQRCGVKPGSMKNLLARALERWRARMGVSK